MADIYGELTEHPEYPIEDARRFTVQIRFHEFVPGSGGRDDSAARRFCARCGYNRNAAVHPTEKTR